MSLLNSALVACLVATLVHHVHNAEYLDAYPNMPASLTPAIVYMAWAGAAIVGIGGHLLLRRGYRVLGALALLAYAAYCLDGLLHYTRAPLAAHTPAMNATIFLEALAGSLLVLALVRRLAAR